MERNEFLNLPRLCADALSEKRGFLRELGALKQRVETADLATLYDTTVPEGAVMGLKYLDLPEYVRKGARVLRELQLDNSSPLRLLDIGAGPATFSYVASLYGHDVVAIERSHAEIRDRSIRYKGLIDFLGVPLSEQTIQPQQPIRIDPILTPKFDRITAFGIMFIVARGGESLFWRSEDYAFLFNDLRKNLLCEGGLLTMQFHGNLFGPPKRGKEDMGPYYSALGSLVEPLVVDPQFGDSVTLDLSRMADWRPLVRLPPVHSVAKAEKRARR